MRRIRTFFRAYRDLVLPGTTGPALCAACGTKLVADEDRETGWRCPGEDAHRFEKLRGAASEFLDAYVSAQRDIPADDLERLDEAEHALREALR